MKHQPRWLVGQQLSPVSLDWTRLVPLTVCNRSIGMTFCDTIFLRMREKSCLGFERNPVQDSSEFPLREEGFQRNLSLDMREILLRIWRDFFSGFERNPVQDSRAILFRIREKSSSGFERNLVHDSSAILFRIRAEPCSGFQRKPVQDSSVRITADTCSGEESCSGF